MKFKTLIFFTLLLSNQMTRATNIFVSCAETCSFSTGITIYIARKSVIEGNFDLKQFEKKIGTSFFVSGLIVPFLFHFIKHPLIDISAIGLSSISLYVSGGILRRIWRRPFYEKDEILMPAIVILCSSFSIYSRASSLINYKNKKKSDPGE